MPSHRQIEALSVYAALMEEIKIRLEAIQALLSQSTLWPPAITREMCFLQLRMCCELIALGSLVAHGDIVATKSSTLQKAYAADYIIKALSELHEEFYPVPFNQQLVEMHRFHMTPRHDTHLTRDKLITLIHRCGNTLHRGNLKSLLKPNPQIQKTHPDIAATLNDIHQLLDKHLIRLMDGNWILCRMNSPDHGGRVQVAIAEPRQES